MKHLEVTGAVRQLEWSLGVKGLKILMCFELNLHPKHYFVIFQH